nr:RNA-directed DNA polymerase, eukaryota, reverse transcriptase zinc-binding domain protein [Tanacetum cinerariifolium]
MKSSTTNVETSIIEEVFHEVSESFQGESSSSSLNDDVQQSPEEIQVAQKMVKIAFENADLSSRVELIPLKIKYANKVVLSFHNEFLVFLSLSRKENDRLLQDQVFKNKKEVVIKNDVVFVGQWSDPNIDIIVHVLDCFYRASGLHINMNKSKLMGVALEDDKVVQAAMKIGCVTIKALFSYLGSKVGGSMSRVQSWNEIIDRVVTRLLNWKMKTLSIGGRLTLIKLVLGSIPICNMSIFKVPMNVLQWLESIRCHFFNGNELLGKKPIWVKWKSVLASKEKGGLGVSSLYALKRALMFKWVRRFFTHRSSLWAGVIKAIHGVEGKIGMSTKATFPSIWVDIIREAEKIKDKWRGEIELKKLYPRLYLLETNKDVSVAAKLAHFGLVSSFRRDPRVVEQSQLVALMDTVSDVSLVNMSDRWVWSLNGLGDFSVASVRKLVDNNTLPEASNKSRWVKDVPIKVNIHAWKVRLDCLPTRLNISHRGLEIDSIICPTCDIVVESTGHIFFTCHLAREIFRKITCWWDVSYSEVSSYEEWFHWISNTRL